MSNYVCNGALLKCSQGVSPATLIVIPPMVNAVKNPMANMMDFAPMVNVPTFGMCNATANPAVIAATSAASGVHTPAPCVPAIVAPWIGFKPDVFARKMQAITKDSKLMCMWSGQIEVTFEGQVTVKEG